MWYVYVYQRVSFCFFSYSSLLLSFYIQKTRLNEMKWIYFSNPTFSNRCHYFFIFYQVKKNTKIYWNFMKFFFGFKASKKNWDLLKITLQKYSFFLHIFKHYETVAFKNSRDHISGTAALVSLQAVGTWILSLV